MRKVFLFLCLMIAGTVALSLSSCGGDDDDSGGNSGGCHSMLTIRVTSLKRWAMEAMTKTLLIGR